MLITVIICVLFGIRGLLGQGGSALTSGRGCSSSTSRQAVLRVLPADSSARAELHVGPARAAEPVSDPAGREPGVPDAGSPAGLDGHPGAASRCPRPACSSGGPGRCARSLASGFPATTRTALGRGHHRRQPAAGGQALLTRALGQDSVVSDSERMPIPGRARSPGLFSSPTPVPVPTVWLNVLPQGLPSRPPAITGQGATVTGPAGPVPVGQVYRRRPGRRQPAAVLRGAPGRPRAVSPRPRRSCSVPSCTRRPPPSLSPSRSAGICRRQSHAGGLRGSVAAIAGASGSAPLCVVYASSGGGDRGWPGRSSSGADAVGGVATGAPAGVSRSCSRPGTAPWSARPRAAGRRAARSATSWCRRAQVRAGVEERGRHARLVSVPEAVLLPASVIDLIPAGPALDFLRRRFAGRDPADDKSVHS